MERNLALEVVRVTEAAALAVRGAWRTWKADYAIELADDDGMRVVIDQISTSVGISPVRSAHDCQPAHGTANQRPCCWSGCGGRR